MHRPTHEADTCDVDTAMKESTVGLRSLMGIVGTVGILLIASVPINDMHAYVSLSGSTRWAYSDLILGGMAFLIAAFTILAGQHPRLPLYLVAAASLSVIIGECLFVFEVLHGDDLESSMSGWLNVLGFYGMFASAAVALVSSLVRMASELAT